MTASFTVGQRIEMYLNLPCNAFQTTLATYTGQNIGADRTDRVKTGVRQTLVISLVMTVIISAVVWVFADNIITLFSLSEYAAAYCSEHLRAIALINVVLSVYIPIFGVFQGSNHSGFPMIVATGALGMRVLVTYLFRYSAFLGHTIIWWNGIFGFGTVQIAIDEWRIWLLFLFICFYIVYLCQLLAHFTNTIKHLFYGIFKSQTRYYFGFGIFHI